VVGAKTHSSPRICGWHSRLYSRHPRQWRTLFWRAGGNHFLEARIVRLSAIWFADADTLQQSPRPHQGLVRTPVPLPVSASERVF